jgi:hypothetical protein
MMKKQILLVEPTFPIPTKSKNHKNFLPIGLLKLYDYYKSTGFTPKIVRGNRAKTEIGTRFKPEQVLITSLFTYWSKSVKDCVEYYRKLFPDAKIIVGGIYASLMPEHCLEYTGCDEVFVGVHKEAEKHASKNHLSYEVLDKNALIDYQILHASRGCTRKCKFCGTWKVEPTFESKKSIKDEVVFRKLVFYDNNFLDNEYIDDILDELIALRKSKKILWCESQSGFDGRILFKKPYLAKKIKHAGFRNPRIAWDWGYKDWEQIKRQIDLFVKAGYPPKEIYVFMIYDWNEDFYEMEKKRIKCWQWKVQISDCRYRPLNQVYDNYNSGKAGQSSKDYYIHDGWTDASIRQFRRNVREQNICVRHGFPFYSKSFEHKEYGKKVRLEVKRMLNLNDKINYLKSNGIDCWKPGKIRYPCQFNNKPDTQTCFSGIFRIIEKRLALG